jgi:hypothetical protein
VGVRRVGGHPLVLASPRQILRLQGALRIGVERFRASILEMPTMLGSGYRPLDECAIEEGLVASRTATRKIVVACIDHSGIVTLGAGHDALLLENGVLGN